jgi:hypothetical protein
MRKTAQGIAVQNAPVRNASKTPRTASTVAARVYPTAHDHHSTRTRPSSLPLVSLHPTLATMTEDVSTAAEECDRPQRSVHLPQVIEKLRTNQ